MFIRGIPDEIQKKLNDLTWATECPRRVLIVQALEEFFKRLEARGLNL